MFNPFACIMKSFVHYSFDFLEGAFLAGAFFAGAFAFFSALASTAAELQSLLQLLSFSLSFHLCGFCVSSPSSQHRLSCTRVL